MVYLCYEKWLKSQFEVIKNLSHRIKVFVVPTTLCMQKVVALKERCQSLREKVYGSGYQKLEQNLAHAVMPLNNLFPKAFAIKKVNQEERTTTKILENVIFWARSENAALIVVILEAVTVLEVVTLVVANNIDLIEVKMD
tara:strand:- start:17 stop:436 length:420 start_codon:yes stop_codon:yes gene_type:complete